MSDVQNQVVVEEDAAATVETAEVVVHVDATQEAPVVTLEQLIAQRNKLMQQSTEAVLVLNRELAAEYLNQATDISVQIVTLQNENLKPIIKLLLEAGRSGLQLHKVACEIDADYKKKFGKESYEAVQKDLFEKEEEVAVKVKKEKKPAEKVYFVRREGDDKVYECGSKKVSNEIKDLVPAEGNLARYHKDRDTAGFWDGSFLRPGGHTNNINDVWNGSGIKPKWVIDALNRIEGGKEQTFIQKLRKNPEQYKEHFIVLTAEQCAKLDFSKLDNVYRPKK